LKGKRAISMLTVYGKPQRVCSGPTRPEMLEAYGAGLFDASLSTVLAAEEAGGTTLPVCAKRVLYLYIYGGRLNTKRGT
jgi:hypothetical protein